MKVELIGAFEAKTRLSELLEHVRTGRIYRITRRGKPIAELRPVVEVAPERLRFGCDRGRIRDVGRLRRAGARVRALPAMTLLLDTHAFLWFVAGDKRLGARARRALERDDQPGRC